MSDKTDVRVTWGARVVAFLLVAGGVLGILAAVFLAQEFARQQPDRMITPLASIIIFAWGVVMGVVLWRGRPAGYKWAKILFILQIPAFRVAQFSYEFSTGISARVLFGHSNSRFGANIGSSLNFLISSDPQGWMFGINLVALVVVAYLYILSRPEQSPQTAARVP